jgi:hypothetical protein
VPTEDLTPWLTRVKTAATRLDVFATLDQFRKLDWTDEQCSAMAKLYIRRLDKLADDGTGEEVVRPPEPQTQDTGPVWYEKM